MLKSLGAVFVLAATFAFSGAALEDDCSNYHQVASYAHDLNYAANGFHDAVHDVTGYGTKTAPYTVTRNATEVVLPKCRTAGDQNRGADRPLQQAGAVTAISRSLM